jgi:hypothetical protein
MTLSVGAGSPHREEDFVQPESTGDSAPRSPQAVILSARQGPGQEMTHFYGNCSQWMPK